ncbi:YARHG domain-containing protein [Terrisporobacter sp.]
MTKAIVENFESFQRRMKTWYIEKKRNKISILKYTLITIVLLITLIGIGFSAGGLVIKEILDKDGKVFEIGEYGNYSEAFIKKYVYNEDNYIINDIQYRYLDEEDLKGFTSDELALIRNEIYAINNMAFKSEPYFSYFNNKSWYNGIYDNVEFDSLTEQAKANIVLIKSMEKKK